VDLPDPAVPPRAAVLVLHGTRDLTTSPRASARVALPRRSRRPGYVQYVERTSALFPLPPKRP
jgi:hypothetical protein